jgi:hypothetical protein
MPLQNGKFLVNLFHKAMEVRAPFGHRMDRIKKEIQEVGFASPNSSPQIQTFA